MPDLKPRPRETKAEEKQEKKKGKRNYIKKSDQKKAKEIERLRDTIHIK